jgi:hypothetical protein
MTQRIPCKECGAEILPTTAQATGGVCMACKNGIRKNIEKSKEYYRQEREKEAAYAPLRTPDLVRTQPVLHPGQLNDWIPVPLPILPRQGIGPFLLGTPRARLREVMAEVGLPLESEKPRMDYCCASALQFEYDDTGCAQFIGASYDARLNVTWEGRNVFDMTARELFDLINAGEPSPLEYNDYDPRFPFQMVTLWDAQEQYDRLGKETRPVWGQVGLCSDAAATL